MLQNSRSNTPRLMNQNAPGAQESCGDTDKWTVVLARGGGSLELVSPPAATAFICGELFARAE